MAEEHDLVEILELDLGHELVTPLAQAHRLAVLRRRSVFAHAGKARGAQVMTTR